MIKILEEKDVSTLKEYVNDDIIRRLDDSRSFFTVLSERTYFLTFYWMDGKKVTIFADKNHLLIASDSTAICEFAQNIDTPFDGVLQLHEFLLEMTASDVHKLESL